MLQLLGVVNERGEELKFGVEDVREARFEETPSGWSVYVKGELVDLTKEGAYTISAEVFEYDDRPYRIEYFALDRLLDPKGFRSVAKNAVPKLLEYKAQSLLRRWLKGRVAALGLPREKAERLIHEVVQRSEPILFR
ncbi:MAG: hypothetical protein HY555_04760 [Euryarchaeota archaeon]|nr:hypothetical protein [Euryarchaeota archaeon]